MRALFLLFALSLLQGCQYDPYAHLYSTNKPKPDDLPGTYTLLRQTVDETNTFLQGKLCLIELRADGTFIASNAPPQSIELPTSNFFDTLLTDSGRWRIDTYGSVDNYDDQPKTVWGIYLDSHSSNTLIHPMHLAGTNSPYGLICTLGHPDTGQAMLFTKQFPPGSTNDWDPFTLDELSNDIDPIGWLFVIVIIFILILFFALALVAGVALLILATVLISLGVLSTSVLTGFLQRSPASGFRALFLQLGAIAGTACGIGATGLVSWAAHAQWHPLSIILLGGFTGLCFGLLIALLFNLAWSRGVDWLLSRFGKNRRIPERSIA